MDEFESASPVNKLPITKTSSTSNKLLTDKGKIKMSDLSSFTERNARSSSSVVRNTAKISYPSFAPLAEKITVVKPASKVYSDKFKKSGFQKADKLTESVEILRNITKTPYDGQVG